MKNKGNQSLLALVLAALLLTVAVSGTLAYLVDRTQTVTNTFTPTQVDITVNQDAYTITNVQDDENVDVYVRAAVLVNWKSGNDVFGEVVEHTFETEAKWVSHTDGFYYYTEKVPVGGTTSVLVKNLSVTSNAPAQGFAATVEILAQAIQAEPKAAVVNAWGVDPETLN